MACKRSRVRSPPAPPLLYLMPHRLGIVFFGLAEITLGSVTLACILDAAIATDVQKPLNILLFVVVSSIISVALGIGILNRLRLARKLLVFFSGWVIVSKILILSRIITLCCELETVIPSYTKNTISIIYHIILIYYLQQPKVKKELMR
jgi:hypothetical protein